jgi:hypothetical protein
MIIYGCAARRNSAHIVCEKSGLVIQQIELRAQKNCPPKKTGGLYETNGNAMRFCFPNGERD